MDIPDINQVFEWLDLKGEVIGIERVLHILPEAKSWMVIRIPLKAKPSRAGRGRRDYPFERSIQEYEDGFATRTLRIALKDPFEHISVFIADALRAGVDAKKNSFERRSKNFKHYQRLRKNWCLIKAVVDDPHSLFSSARGKLVADAAKAAGRQKSEVYDYCIRYWQRGQVPGSIAPLYAQVDGESREVKVAGKKRGPRVRVVNGEQSPHTELAIGPEERNKLLKGIKRFRLKNRYPLQEAYDHTIREFWSEKIELLDGMEMRGPLPLEQCPSYKQFLNVWYKYKNKNTALVKKALSGERKFVLTERLLDDNHTRKASQPGQRFEIDAHLADCHLVHSVTRLPIGRPTVYFVVDVFSHEIVGVAITLEPPSYIGAALALINAFTDKIEFCKLHGIDIKEEEWPCHHLCKDIVADRGELLTDNADVLSELFDVRRVILPGYRPDMKPLVERFFKRLNEKIRHKLPGAVLGPKQRGERNPKLDARLDITQYSEMVIRTVLELNSEWMSGYKLEKAMIADDIKPIPLNLWKWGVKNRSGVLRQKTKAFVQANLLPRSEAAITRSGIELKGLEYSLPSSLSEDWQLACNDANAKVRIAYDPRLVDAIYLCDHRGEAGEYEACALKSKCDAHLGWSWRELELWSRKQSHEQKKAKDSVRRKKMENDIRMDAALREAEAKHAAAIHPSLSKTAFLKGSSENRENARRRERQSSPLIKKPVLKVTDAAGASVSNEETAPGKIVHFPEKSRSAREAEYLRSLRDGK